MSAEKFPHPYRSRSEKLTIIELADSMLDGRDYDNGYVEAAQKTADNLSQAFGRLIHELRKNRALTKKQAYRVVTGYELKDEDCL